MKEFVGSILEFIIPWLLPAVLVSSWLVNHKTPTAKTENKETKTTDKKTETSTSTSANKEATQQVNTEQATVQPTVTVDENVVK